MSGRKDLGADWAASSGRRSVRRPLVFWYYQAHEACKNNPDFICIFPQLGTLGDSQRGRAPDGARGCARTTLLPYPLILL